MPPRVNRSCPGRGFREGASKARRLRWKGLERRQRKNIFRNAKVKFINRVPVAGEEKKKYYPVFHPYFVEPIENEICFTDLAIVRITSTKSACGGRKISRERFTFVTNGINCLIFQGWQFESRKSVPSMLSLLEAAKHSSTYNLMRFKWQLTSNSVIIRRQTFKRGRRSYLVFHKVLILVLDL